LEQAGRMNRISFCLPYYENPGMLAKQMHELHCLPAVIRDCIEFIVVDDGSPYEPALPAFLNRCEGLNARLYRMLVDVRWNQDACRNLAAAEASHPWLLLTDMDHVPSRELWEAIVTERLSPTAIYRFSRVSAPDLTPYKPHPNSYLITREMYDRIGGYDERFAGLYGTDWDFYNSARKLAPIVELPFPLIRYSRDVIPDASTRTLQRKESGDIVRVKVLRAQIAKLPAAERRPVRNRFPWVRLV